MPANLSRDRFEAAHRFVLENGRPLDGALVNFSLGQGTAEAVMVALIAFQNPDGGFGHGLEPDMRSPASTAIATASSSESNGATWHTGPKISSFTTRADSAKPV